MATDIHDASSRRVDASISSVPSNATVCKPSSQSVSDDEFEDIPNETSPIHADRSRTTSDTSSVAPDGITHALPISSLYGVAAFGLSPVPKMMNIQPPRPRTDTDDHALV